MICLFFDLALILPLCGEARLRGYHSVGLRGFARRERRGPTGLAVTPDERLLVTTQPGKLQVVDKNGELLTRPALDLTGKVCTNSERGLLGVTEDPGFVSNNYIYLYYTAYQSGGCVNRVSRFTMSGDTAD